MGPSVLDDGRGEETITSYYAPYHGHDVRHLGIALTKLREKHDSVVFLAGDSSLDNKFWFDEWSAARNGYEEVLRPQVMKKDVCFWMNDPSAEPRRACLNAAVEATALDDRAFGALLPQDAFLRDHISADDVLVVSVGGNDVALAPTACTAVHMGVLTRCTPLWCLGGDSNSEAAERQKPALPIQLPFACPPNVYALPGSGGARNCDCGRACCGVPGCVAGACGCPCGFGYAVDLFGNRVQNYVRRLVSRTKPKKVLVCTIYYPRERRATRGEDATAAAYAASASWADPALRALGYDADPRHTRALIRAVHAHATSRITVPGVPVTPVPLFEVLDPRDARDYEQRVEPSAAGGRKMARAIAEYISASSPRE